MIDFSVYEQKQAEVNALKCPGCGTLYYPAPMVCKKCDGIRDPVTGKHWEEFDLEGPCTLLTWTRVWNLPEGFNKKYLMFGMVEFENGLRASGRLEVEGDPQLGAKLVARVVEADERPGLPVKVFVFS